MAGNLYNAKTKVEVGQRYGVPLGERMGYRRDRFGGRAVDRDIITLSQFCRPAHMIGVMVGAQNGDQVEFFAHQESEDRVGIAGIDGSHAGSRAIRD